MDQSKIDQFKKNLEGQRQLVERELRELGWQDEGTGEWEAAEKHVDTSATEQDELADRVEEYDENRAEVAEIEPHWKSIVRALRRIEDGTYGVCEVCGEEIELDRLEANPAARTCKAHVNEEGELTN